MNGITVIFIILAVLILYIIAKYNSLVSKRNKIKQAASGIDVYLTQRFDLIPNLVECVKGYMTYEKEILTEITEQRTKYLQNKNLKDGELLERKCNEVIAIAENYPELKANEQFLNLQKNLSKIESQLQAARRIYNAEVNVYNTTIQKFPGSFIASSFGFTEEEYFQAEEQAKGNVTVNI